MSSFTQQDEFVSPTAGLPLPSNDDEGDIVAAHKPVAATDIITLEQCDAAMQQAIEYCEIGSHCDNNATLCRQRLINPFNIMKYSVSPELCEKLLAIKEAYRKLTASSHLLLRDAEITRMHGGVSDVI
jgi:hypothetical protein